MRGVIGAVLLACAAVEPSLAGTSSAPVQGPSVPDILKQVEQNWEDAVQARDVDSVSEIEADDWRSVGLDGSVSTKQSDLSGLKSGKGKHIRLELGPIDVKVLSETIAVVQGIATERPAAGADNIGPANRYAYMDVFVKRADRWMVVRSLAVKLK